MVFPLPAARLDSIEVSLIRQINALATPLSVNLGIGEPNVEPDAEFREMAARAAREGSWHYTAIAGTLSLRRRIAEVLAPLVDPLSEICVTAGTEEGLYAIMQAWVGKGDEVLVPEPGFLAYEALARMAGASVRSYPLDPDGWKIDLPALEAQLTSSTKLLVVNSPSNPLGSVIPAVTMQKLAELAEERGFLLVSDEVYGEIFYGERPASMLGRGKNILVVNGLSKSHSMTGLRLGWVIAPEALMPPILKAHQYIATCASTFSQSLAESVFTDVQWNQRWLGRMREQFSRQRDVALSAIARHLEIPIVPPGGAFYAFVPVPVCETVALARSLATEEAVLTIPGVAFGQRGEGFLRISYAAAPEAISAGIERIGRYLSGVRGQGSGVGGQDR